MPYFEGGRVLECPASSSPAPVGVGALRACWWWEMWVPPFSEKAPSAVGWGDHCLAVLRTYWGGSHPPPLSSPCPVFPQPVSPLHKTVLRSFSPLSPDWGGGVGSAAAAFHCLWED